MSGARLGRAAVALSQVLVPFLGAVGEGSLREGAARAASDGASGGGGDGGLGGAHDLGDEAALGEDALQEVALLEILRAGDDADAGLAQDGVAAVEHPLRDRKSVV